VATEPFLDLNPHALHIEPESEPANLHASQELQEKDNEEEEDDDDEDDRPDAPLSQFLVEASRSKHGRGAQRMFQPRAPARPGVRVALALLCLVLASGLVLQIVVQERDRIAATEPAVTPALERLCGWLACKIAPVRQIESVIIDSSAFAKVRSDVYRLSFALKNTAQIDLAMPALELTLTDMQDQPVVRRVFTAADYGKQQTVLEPGAELLTTLPVSVKLPPGSEHISGYRLLSFYP